MGPVEWMVGTVEGFLDAAAESTFAAIAGTLGGILMVASTLLIILVLAGFALQTRPMGVGSAVGLLVRLVLINLFALDWVQFNAVSTALIDGLDGLGAAMVEAVGGAVPAGGFPAAFDDVMADFADYLNAMTDNMGWMGGAVVTGVGLSMMGLVGALAAGVLIFAQVMLTILVGIAPVMIATSLFEATKDYFHRWLSNLVGYALYPLVMAGVMSTIIGMASAMADAMGDPAEGATIGSLMPFFAMMFLAAGMIAVIPLLVRALSGNIVMGRIGSVLGADALNMTAGAFSGAALQARYAAAGLFDTRGSQARARSGNRGVTETVAAGVSAGVRANAAHGARMVETMERSRRLEASGAIPAGLKPKQP